LPWLINWSIVLPTFRSWWVKWYAVIWTTVERFKFYDQLSVFCINLISHKQTIIFSEGMDVSNLPSLFIKEIEVISPTKPERLIFRHIFPVLNVVVSGIPRHFGCLEPLPPRIEIRYPEVHHQGLFPLPHPSHCRVF